MANVVDHLGQENLWFFFTFGCFLAFFVFFGHKMVPKAHFGGLVQGVAGWGVLW